MVLITVHGRKMGNRHISHNRSISICVELAIRKEFTLRIYNSLLY